ncbi:putative F-box domain-containing protein [Helianthus anomalus]
MRMDAEGDRLSSLQDDLILKILSFVGLKDAIGTSVLSPRWRYLWTSIPHLNFSSEDFSTMDKLSDYVTRVLSRRNNQAQLSSIDLYLRLKDGHDVAHMIMNYAFSHNVQKVNLTCLFGNIITCIPEENIGFSLSLSSSQTIKHLTFSSSFEYQPIALITSTSELSSLTTMHLDYIRLYDGFFSQCPNLENLTLICCRMMRSKIFRICHPRLSNLTVDHGYLASDTLHVVTPQLRNLTITSIAGSYLISAPELASLLLTGLAPYMFSTDGFHSLEKAQLSLYCLNNLDSPYAPKVISLLQNLHSVKDISLSLEIIELLHWAVELISHQPSPFANLKCLKILPRMKCEWRRGHAELIMSAEVKNFLLNGSPEATLTEVCTRT